MTIKEKCIRVTSELCEIAKLKKGDIFLVGCSTSEVLGDKIGTNSTIEIAEEIFSGINEVLIKKGIHIAVQCCEHLNRAIVTDLSALKGEEPVNVIPQKKAGGALATIAYMNLKKPVVVENLKCNAGIDIGGTLIGMHLKSVAVPVRLSIKAIGKANIICARTRPKFIGGVRAEYDKELL